MKSRGVTLLETLVALALTALLLGTLSRSLAGAARSRTAAGAESDRISAARTVLLRLAAEIEAAVPETGIVLNPSAGLRVTAVVRSDPGAMSMPRTSSTARGRTSTSQRVCHSVSPKQRTAKRRTPASTASGSAGGSSSRTGAARSRRTSTPAARSTS